MRKYFQEVQNRQMKIYGIYDEEEKEQCVIVRNSARDNKVYRNNSKEI